MDFKGSLKKTWNFLKEDNWPSFFVSLVLFLIFIKFILFPILIFLTGSPLPLVIVESCSMYHTAEWEINLENNLYKNNEITLENVSDFKLKNGFTKGDIILVFGPEDIAIGDIIIFNAGQKFSYPLIHRVISIKNESGRVYYSTKGDNYRTNSGQLAEEVKISQDQILGKAVFKVPYLGWIKLFFFDLNKPSEQRGLCR